MGIFITNILLIILIIIISTLGERVLKALGESKGLQVEQNRSTAAQTRKIH